MPNSTPEQPRGNDGLTDEEREQYAKNYVTHGAGRPLDGPLLELFQLWVAARKEKENTINPATRKELINEATKNYRANPTPANLDQQANTINPDGTLIPGIADPDKNRQALKELITLKTNPVSENTNALEHLACTNCGHQKSFTIIATVVAVVHDDGIDSYHEPEWETTSPVTCRRCGYAATIREFAWLKANPHISTYPK